MLERYLESYEFISLIRSKKKLYDIFFKLLQLFKLFYFKRIIDLAC